MSDTPITVDGRTYTGHIDWDDGSRSTHVDCPCWKSGSFNQVPCPWHDGNGRYPYGAFAESIKESE